jgi:hypothetical protein
VVRGDQTDLGGGGGAEGDQTPAGEAGLQQRARVVRVGHGGRVFAQGVEQLPLGISHPVERAGALQVHGTDVGDEPHVRVDPAGEPRDLAEVVHARFDHRVLVLGGEPQERERHAHFVVQVPFRLEGRARGRQDGSDQLLGGGLSRRPGDADHPQGLQALAPRMRQPSQRAARVRGGEDRGQKPLGGELALDALRRCRRNQDPRRPRPRSVGRKPAAVVMLPDQRDEERPADRVAGVGERALEPLLRVARQELRAGSPGCLARAEGGAHRMASSARRASTRSSKLRFSSPTIW